MKTQLILISSLATMISAKPRRAHDLVQKSNDTQKIINHDAYARMFAKIRAKTRIIARKIQLEKLYALKKRQASNFGAMDLDETRRHRKIQKAKFKESKNSFNLRSKFLGDAGQFGKRRNTYRLNQRKLLTKFTYDRFRSKI